MNQLKLDKKKNYLLACSYGPDSMALFYLLKSQGYKFDCAIVNYHLREESDKEVADLLEYANKFNVKVYVFDVKKVPVKNIEAECRRIRYLFFKELTDKNGYSATLVAHHLDDLIETYIMQKQRQNCPIYYGIKENTVISGVNIIRPLLSYSKNELLSICEKNNVPFSIDKTNYDQSINRNRIRYQIVLKFRDRQKAKIVDEINEENSKLKEMLDFLHNTDLNDIQTMLSLGEIEQRYALNILLENIDQETKLSKDNVGQIISILKSCQPNGIYHIKKDIYLIKEYENFHLSVGLKNTQNALYSFVIDKPSKLDTPYFYLDFSKDASNRNVTFDDYPLTIRNIRSDDVVTISDYQVKARRLLIDWKVPHQLRLIWPVILNKDNKIIYVPRYRSDFKIPQNCNFYVKVSNS